MIENGKQDIPKLMQDDARIQQALRAAVQAALRTHKLLGQPVVARRDGKVTWIPPEEISLLSEDNGHDPLR